MTRPPLVHQFALAQTQQGVVVASWDMEGGAAEHIWSERLARSLAEGILRMLDEPKKEDPTATALFLRRAQT